MATPPPIDPRTGLPDLTTLAGINGAGGTVDNSGALSIWNLPTDLPTGLKIWFDVRHGTKTTESTDGAALGPPPAGLLPGVTQPGVPAPPAPTGAASRERSTPTSHEILRSPAAIMKQYAAMSFNDPAQFFALQKALAFGPWGTVQPTGSFDAATEKALGNAMLQYVKLTHGAGVGVSFTDYLMTTSQRNAQLNPAAGGGSGTTPDTSISVTDPAAIKSAAQTAAQAALGKGLSSGQLDQFVAQFQSSEASARTATSGQVSYPVLSSQADAFAQQADPKAYHQNQRDVFLSSLVNLLAPPGAALRPNMTPTPSAGG